MQVVAPPLTVSGCQNETISAIIAAWSNSGNDVISATAGRGNVERIGSHDLPNIVPHLQ